MSLLQYFQSIIERLQSSAIVKTVFGDPITAEGKTIIPVAKVGYCFGVGIGSPPIIAKKSPDKSDTGGMGGAFRAKPLGVLEITKEETKFIPIEEKKKLMGVLLIGLFLGVLLAKRSRK